VCPGAHEEHQQKATKKKSEAKKKKKKTHTQQEQTKKQTQTPPPPTTTKPHKEQQVEWAYLAASSWASKLFASNAMLGGGECARCGCRAVCGSEMVGTSKKIYTNKPREKIELFK
jgi:hypothetical protein